MGVERTPNKKSAHKVDSGEENSPAALAGIRTRNLSITSLAFLPASYPDYPDWPLYYCDVYLDDLSFLTLAPV